MHEHGLSIPAGLAPFVADIVCDRLGDFRPEVEWNWDLEENDGELCRIRLRLTPSREIRQDDWRLRLRPGFRPTFHWSPHLTPTDEHIVDQHAFRSPALIVYDGSKLLALVPDLDLLSGKAQPTRWYMDLNAEQCAGNGLEAAERRQMASWWAASGLHCSMPAYWPS